MMQLDGKNVECVSVLGARVHNLKNIDVEIPHNRLTVVTGLSGSGKSSLAFDTIFAEDSAGMWRHSRHTHAICSAPWNALTLTASTDCRR